MDVSASYIRRDCLKIPGKHVYSQRQQRLSLQRSSARRIPICCESCSYVLGPTREVQFPKSCTESINSSTMTAEHSSHIHQRGRSDRPALFPEFGGRYSCAVLWDNRSSSCGTKPCKTKKCLCGRWSRGKAIVGLVASLNRTSRPSWKKKQKNMAAIKLGAEFVPFPVSCPHNTVDLSRGTIPQNFPFVVQDFKVHRRATAKDQRSFRSVDVELFFQPLKPTN